MKVRIEKGVAYGKISAPPSKSMAHRLLISAALSNGKSVLRGVSDCEDVRATERCLRALGAKFEKCGDVFTVYGTNARRSAPTLPLDCNESGSTLRFIIPVAALSDAPISFTGAGRLMQRPMSIYEKLFFEKGIYYCSDEEIITVKGALTGGEYCVAGNVSSQFISGLIFALPLAERDSYIKIIPPIESLPYINLTLEAVSRFGIKADFIDECTIKIPGSQTYKPADVTVEGDYSGAAFIESLNLFGGGVEVEMTVMDNSSFFFSIYHIQMLV